MANYLRRRGRTVIVGIVGPLDMSQNQALSVPLHGSEREVNVTYVAPTPITGGTPNADLELRFDESDGPEYWNNVKIIGFQDTSPQVLNDRLDQETYNAMLYLSATAGLRSSIGGMASAVRLNYTAGGAAGTWQTFSFKLMYESEHVAQVAYDHLIPLFGS